MSAVDNFASYSVGPDSPASGIFAIVPHAVNELPYVTRAIRIGVAGGTIECFFVDGTTAILPVQAYEILPFRLKRVGTATTVDAWGLV